VAVRLGRAERVARWRKDFANMTGEWSGDWRVERDADADAEGKEKKEREGQRQARSKPSPTDQPTKSTGP